MNQDLERLETYTNVAMIKQEIESADEDDYEPQDKKSYLMMDTDRGQGKEKKPA